MMISDDDRVYSLRRLIVIQINNNINVRLVLSRYF